MGEPLIMPEELLPHLVIGCGYLGRRVAARWREQGRAVIAVTRSPDRAAEFRRDGLTPYVADICQSDTLRDLPAVDRILFAVGYDRGSGRTQEEVFVNGLRNVLEIVGPKCRRFISISSTSVYGQQDGSWVDETSPCDPVQPGGICCLAAEHLIRESFDDQSVRSAIRLRLAGIYGPQRLLSRVADLQAGKPLPGRPDAWLNLIHVDDAANAVIAAGESESQSSLYLVADDQPLQRGDYYARLAELVGAPRPQFDENQERSRGSGGLNKRCSNRQLRADLGLQLLYPTVETGLLAALQIDG